MKASSTPIPRLRSPREVEEMTGVPRSTWYTLVARGELPAVRIGRAVWIDEADLVAFIAARRERAS
jgi:excisionase family DNA binding protein